MRLFWCCLQAAVCFVQDLGSLCGRLHRFTLRAQDVAAQKNRRPDQLPSALSLPSSPLHFSLIFEAAASGQWPGGSCFPGGTPSITSTPIAPLPNRRLRTTTPRSTTASGVCPKTPANETGIDVPTTSSSMKTPQAKMLARAKMSSFRMTRESVVHRSVAVRHSPRLLRRLKSRPSPHSRRLRPPIRRRW